MNPYIATGSRTKMVKMQYGIAKDVALLVAVAVAFFQRSVRCEVIPFLFSLSQYQMDLFSRPLGTN